MHSGVFELTKLTYTRLEDNLIRHRGDQFFILHVVYQFDSNAFTAQRYSY